MGGDSPAVAEWTGDGTPVVLVTGAASGIGAATARACADRGWTVYATDVDTSFPADVRERCRCRELDVTDSEACQRVVDDVLAAEGRIDGLVNNAGYAEVATVGDVDLDAQRRQFDVLVGGVVALCQAVLPAMRDAGRGRIVTVSSVLALSTYPGLGVYSAGKAAVERLTDALRMELADSGVDAVLVEPAWVDTDFAATALDGLDDTDRRGIDERTYDTLADGWMLTGGPAAASPAAVAEAVHTALATERPRARYPVGRFARFVRWAHVLPAALQDPIRRVLGRASVVAERVRRYLGRLR